MCRMRDQIRLIVSIFLISLYISGLCWSENPKGLWQFAWTFDVSVMIVDHNTFLSISIVTQYLSILSRLWIKHWLSTYSTTVDNLISYHTQIRTWAIVSVLIWITNFSSSHTLIHLSLMFLQLVLDHRILLSEMSIRWIILSWVWNIIINVLWYIPLFLFTHWTLNELLHLDDASVSLASLLREISGIWLHHHLLSLIFVILKIFLVFNDAHFIYLVLVHVSLNSCTVTDSSGPCVAHWSWSFLMIDMIIDYLIWVISVSSWRLKDLWQVHHLVLLWSHTIYLRKLKWLLILPVSIGSNTNFKCWSISLEHLLVWRHWNSFWLDEIIAEFDLIEYFVWLLCRFLKVHVFDSRILAGLRLVFLLIVLVQTTEGNFLGFTLEHGILFFDILHLSLKSLINTLSIIKGTELRNLKLTWSSMISTGWWNTSFDTLACSSYSLSISCGSLGTWLCRRFWMLNYITYVTLVVFISLTILRREQIDLIHFIFRTLSTLFFFG